MSDVDDAITQAQEGWLPKRQKELADLCGLQYEVEWESFAGDLKGVQWLENNGPHQITMAFRMLCNTGDAAKEAIGKNVTKVVVKNADDKKLTFADGVLTVEGAFNKGGRGRFAGNDIKKYLEAEGVAGEITPPEKKGLDMDPTHGLKPNLERAMANKAVVSLHLRSGTTVAGQVGKVSAERVVITQITGREFYDASISLGDVSALELRAR